MAVEKAVVSEGKRVGCKKCGHGAKKCSFDFITLIFIGALNPH
jgi:hypothetical protein